MCNIKARTRSQRLAAGKSTENTRNILLDETDRPTMRFAPQTPVPSDPGQSPGQSDPGRPIALLTEEVPPVIQLALYGAEMLCRGPYVTHSVNLLIQGITLFSKSSS